VIPQAILRSRYLCLWRPLQVYKETASVVLPGSDTVWIPRLQPGLKSQHLHLHKEPQICHTNQLFVDDNTWAGVP
jgi:hypothetical protein